jgi:hypothetical protein
MKSLSENPLASLTTEDWLLVVAGVGVAGVVVYLFWSAGQPTSPAISVAASEGPGAPAPVPNAGLAAGYYWEDQNNATVPALLGNVQALAMSPDDVASAVSGNVVLPPVGGSVTFMVTGTGSDPNNGISVMQTVTLPLSYVVPA